MMSPRIRATSITRSDLTSISTPPLKSMPKLKPYSQMEMTETKTSNPSMAKATKRYLTKSTLVVSGMNRSSGMAGRLSENPGEPTGPKAGKQAGAPLAQTPASARVSAKSRGPSS